MAQETPIPLEQLKQALGIIGTSEDDVLSALYQGVKGWVLRYINWEELPKELEYPLFAICVSYYYSLGRHIGKDGKVESAKDTSVSSVTRGDTSVTYAHGSDANGGRNLGNAFYLGPGDQGDGFFGWKTVLAEYRKLRW